MSEYDRGYKNGFKAARRVVLGREIQIDPETNLPVCLMTKATEYQRGYIDGFDDACIPGDV